MNSSKTIRTNDVIYRPNSSSPFLTPSIMVSIGFVNFHAPPGWGSTADWVLALGIFGHGEGILVFAWSPLVKYCSLIHAHLPHSHAPLTSIFP